VRRAAGLLTWGSLVRRLPGSRQWHLGGGASPLTAAGPSRTHTGFPDRAPLLSAETSILPVTASRASAWLPVVVWAAVIFAFSAIPGLGTGLGVWDTILRKCAHTLEYAILGALLLRALGREAPAFLAGVAYAVSDEIHQHFVGGRHGSPVDVAIDSAGVLLGILVFQRARRWQP
jgi:VanZ family protein